MMRLLLLFTFTYVQRTNFNFTCFVGCVRVEEVRGRKNKHSLRIQCYRSFKVGKRYVDFLLIRLRMLDID